MKESLTATTSVPRLFKGLVILNMILSPFTLLVVLFIGIMGGGSPDSPGAVYSFALAAGFVFLLPVGVLLWHAFFAKIIDAVFRITAPLTMEISRFGILGAGLLFVIAGNVFVDDLYQFKRGQYLISVYALVFDLVGIAIINLAGGIRFALVDRIFRTK